MNPEIQRHLLTIAHNLKDSYGERKVAFINGLFLGAGPQVLYSADPLPKIVVIYDFCFQIHKTPSGQISALFGLTDQPPANPAALNQSAYIMKNFLHDSGSPLPYFTESTSPLRVQGLKELRKSNDRYFSMAIDGPNGDVIPYSAWLTFSKIDDSFLSGIS